ncbi:MAG: ferrous iron transporter B [Firmicutes bacterium]|nr:ferrous iron transporter B [Bacillota bacterium]
MKTVKIALTGNPNSGKTTLYNAVTGRTEYIGNWPGVTVQKKETKLKRKYSCKNVDVRIVDLPGAYSISPFTDEEAITRNFILNQRPDVIINIIDGANISRSLYFTTQLLELSIPVVTALNKNDIIAKRQDIVNIPRLEQELGCPVIPITATKEQGLIQLITTAVEAVGKNQVQVLPPFAYSESLLRQKYIDKIIKNTITKKADLSTTTLSDKLDKIIAHKWLGIPIFFALMCLVYYLSIDGIGGYLSTYLNNFITKIIIPDTAAFLAYLKVPPLLKGLVVNGAVAGLGAVIGFLPLIMILFFCLSLLEDSGYMARIAVIMDGHFKKIGLSGKSIIPMIIGSGCAIPGVMAVRTIENVNEKRMTAILTPFIPCGAKLPIIALFAAVFYPKSSWVGPSIYFTAIIVIVLGGLLLQKLFLWEQTSSFVIELPEYKIPSLKHAFNQMFYQARNFIRKASTIILVMNTLVWFMQGHNYYLQPVADQSVSMLSTIGNLVSPLLTPLGFVGWQPAVAIITGFAAKENVVATLAILLGIASTDLLHTPGGPLAQFFNPVTAYAFLIFNLFAPPCFAAVSAMNAELGRKWLLRGLAFQFCVGYILAMIISQIGTLIIYGKFAHGFQSAIIISILLFVIIIWKIRRTALKPKKYSLFT